MNYVLMACLYDLLKEKRLSICKNKTKHSINVHFRLIHLINLFIYFFNMHLYQGRSQDFSKGGSQTGTPSGDHRLYMVYTAALPRVSAGSVVLSRHEGSY